MSSIKPFGRYFGDGSDTDETSKRKIGQWIIKYLKKIIEYKK